MALSNFKAASTSIFGEALTLNGDGATVGADTSGGALRNLSGNNIYNGAVALGSASTIQSDAGTLSINGGISGAFGLTVSGAGNTVINGIIGTAAGTLIKNDSGTLTLANANTYTGLTTINGGTVIVSNALGLGTVAGGVTVASGATLNISGVTVAETPVTLNGTGFGGNGALTGTGVATVSGTVALANQQFHWSRQRIGYSDHQWCDFWHGHESDQSRCRHGDPLCRHG